MNNKNERKLAYQNGLREGFNQGIIQGKKICADKMLILGFKINDIKKVTGFNKEDIYSYGNKYNYINKKSFHNN